MKVDEETIARSLQGNWREEHLFALTLVMERCDFLSGQLERCEACIEGALKKLSPRTAISTIGAETALTIGAFASAEESLTFHRLSNVLKYGADRSFREPGPT